MNRLVKFCAGLMLITSMSGCCLLGGYGYGAGYPGFGGGGGACGNCGPCGGGYPSAYGPTGATAFAPMPTTAFAPAYPTVAMDPLPTYQ